jgi:predicted flap endonuclease-1-like 5' DNA nuclease
MSCILIPVLVGLISGILGYLIGKMSSPKVDNSALLTLESELNTVRAQLNTCKADLRTCQANLSNAAAPVFNSALAANIFGRRIIQDDLKVVEGIGPKIEALYHAAGIKTWLALSKTSKETSLQILHGGGERFAMHDPGTWAKQAEMAYNGRWQELKDWQDKLDGGKAE